MDEGAMLFVTPQPPDVENNKPVPMNIRSTVSKAEHTKKNQPVALYCL